MIDKQFIKKPSGFHKQRLDAFVRSVKTNKEDVQRKALDEALEQHTLLSAQDMVGRAMELPAFEDMQQMYAQQMMGGMPQAAYGMEIGAVMPSAPAPFSYPSQMNITPPSSEAFKKQADRYEGKGLSSLKGLFNTTANAILNPAIMEYNKQVYANQQAAEKAQEDLPEEKTGGDLPKAQILGTTGAFGTTGTGGGTSSYKPREVQDAESALQQALSMYQSDEPAYDADGNLLTKEQLEKAAQDAYNNYYTAVGQAFKDNPTPTWAGPGDMSYLYNYPTRDGLILPDTYISGPGASPELFKGTAAAQRYSNFGIDRPGLGTYMGLSPYKYMTVPDMEYSQNYKEMYKDATSKGQYDRFLTEFEADPTAAGRFLDKLGVGKLFDTRNYNINQTILPEGQSIFDADRMEAYKNQMIKAENADMPGGGLFQTDEMNPYIWESRSRRDRRDVLESAGIDPNRKNLRRLGKDYFENLAQDRQREEYEASREGYENKLAAEEEANKRAAGAGMIGTRPRNPWDLVGTGVQTSTPAAPPVIPAVGTNSGVPQTTVPQTTSAVQPFYNTKYDWNAVQKENADFIKKIGEFETTKGSITGTGLSQYDPLITKPEKFYNWEGVDYSGHDKTKARFKGFDANALPKDLREVVLDQSINQSQDPRVTLLMSQGILSDADRFDYLNGANVDKLDKIFTDPKNQEILSKAYNEDPNQFINTYLDQRLVTYGRTNKKGIDMDALNKMTAVEKDKYLSSLPVSDTYNLSWKDRAEQYRKQDGGTMLPMFQIDGEFGFDNGLTEVSYPARNMTAEFLGGNCPEGYRRGSDGMCYPITDIKYYAYHMDTKDDDQKLTGLDAKQLPVKLNNLPITQQNISLPKQYDKIDWNISDPFSKKQGPFNYDQGFKKVLPDPTLFPDADKMQTFFDNGNAPLTAEAFSKQLDQYVPKYTGTEPQSEATASGKGKIRSTISPAGYLNIANATGKYLADGIFSRDERRNADRQYRASRFLENNLALTSPDTQFSPRLRGFDRTTDAFAGAPFAGANVQYGQPLIPQYAQKGAELFMTMQQGGVYTLTPEMIKQIIENGGEVEYVDNNYNFDNPYNR